MIKLSSNISASQQHSIPETEREMMLINTGHDYENEMTGVLGHDSAL